MITALLALSTASSQADTVQVQTKAVADANISQHINLGSGTVPLGTGKVLYEIAPVGTQGSSLLQFDLSAWSGRQLLGNAQLDLTYLSMYYGNSVDLSIRSVGTAWNEATVTWANFSNDVSAPVSSATVASANYAYGSQVHFSLPQSLVQQWLDVPSSNHGLILQATAGRTLLFAAREFQPTGGQVGAFAPQLSFAAATPVPENESWALLTAGLVALVALARRRRSA